MRFTEVNLLGVYVAPISVMLVAAWLVTIALRRIAARFDLLRHVWHPALFVFAVYTIVLSSIVLGVGGWARHVPG
jgi:protein AaeX